MKNQGLITVLFSTLISVGLLVPSHAQDTAKVPTSVPGSVLIDPTTLDIQTYLLIGRRLRVDEKRLIGHIERQYYLPGNADEFDVLDSYDAYVGNLDRKYRESEISKSSEIEFRITNYEVQLGQFDFDGNLYPILTPLVFYLPEEERVHRGGSENRNFHYASGGEVVFVDDLPYADNVNNSVHRKDLWLRLPFDQGEARALNKLADREKISVDVQCDRVTPSEQEAGMAVHLGSLFCWVRDLELHSDSVRDIRHFVWDAAANSWMDKSKGLPGYGSQLKSKDHVEEEMPSAPAKQIVPSMEARFTGECAGVSDVACPYVEERTCMGEGCYSQGIVEFTAPITLYTEPGSSDVVTAAQLGSYWGLDTTTVYSRPCAGRIVSSQNPRLMAGENVYLLSSAGEGVYRVLKGKKVESTWIDDSISLLDQQCPGRSEEWLKLVSETGERGWALLDFSAMLGTSIYEPLTKLPPEWTWHFATDISEYYFTGNGGLCQSIGVPLTGDRLASLFVGVRITSKFPSGLKARSYDVSKTDSVLRSLDIFSDGGTYNGSSRLSDSVACAKTDGFNQETCYRILPCADDDEFPYVARDLQGRDLVLFSRPEFSARLNDKFSAAVSTFSDRTVPLLTASMQNFSGAALSCKDDFTLTCLKAAGVPGAEAAVFSTLGKHLGLPFFIESFRDLGDAQFARIEFPTMANSNLQDIVLGAYATSWDEGVVDPQMLQKSADHAASELRRRYPNAFVDMGRGKKTYFSWKTGRPGFYFAYPVVDGCRACDIVGSVAVSIEVVDGYVHATPTFWKSETDESWLASTNEYSDRALEFYKAHPDKLQAALAFSGYDPGPVDGAPGQKTKMALRDFQHTHCLPPFGKLDESTAAALFNRAELWGECYQQ